MSNCSVCRKEITEKEPAVLVMSGFAYPRYICAECESLFDKATLSHDPEEINSSIEEIGNRLVRANNDDKLILESVSNIIDEAKERGALIAGGEYDFSNDECEISDDQLDDVPEDLLETEEDKALDEKEKKRNKTLDLITNIICTSALVLALAFVAYRVISAIF